MNLTREQVAQLLHAIKPDRVMRDNDGQSHVTQHDIRAHLTRIFGFGNWKKEIVSLRCVREEMVTVPAKNNRPARDVPAVTYVCQLRLYVRGQGDSWEDGWWGDDVGTGTSPNLPTWGDAHDFAAKNAVSYAIKRCATDLGDQFGLSLYNRGQLEALVGGTMVWPNGTDPTDRKRDVQEGVPKQVDLGDERPAEVDTSTGEVSRPAPRPAVSDERQENITQAKTRVVSIGKRLGLAQETDSGKLDLSDLEARFAEEHDGLAMRAAGLLQLQSFADGLERTAANGSVPA